MQLLGSGSGSLIPTVFGIVSVGANVHFSAQQLEQDTRIRSFVAKV